MTALVKKRRIGSSLRKAILLYMADAASDDGTGIWTSKLNIAADLEVDPTTIRRHIVAMIEAGIIIEAGKRERAAGGYTVDYSIDLAAVARLPSTRTGQDSRSGTEPDRAEDPMAVGQSARSRSGRAPDKPSVEPPVEPPEGDTGASEREDDPPPQQETDLLKEVKLPSGWVPSEADVAYAREFDLTDEEIRGQADEFEYYWTEGAGKKTKRTVRGWGLTWKKWVRRAAPEVRKSRPMGGRQGPMAGRQSSGVADYVARANAAENGGEDRGRGGSSGGR